MNQSIISFLTGAAIGVGATYIVTDKPEPKEVEEPKKKRTSKRKTTGAKSASTQKATGTSKRKTTGAKSASTSRKHAGKKAPKLKNLPELTPAQKRAICKS